MGVACRDTVVQLVVSFIVVGELNLLSSVVSMSPYHSSK